MAKPVMLVTRKVPEAIEAGVGDGIYARLNTEDATWGIDRGEGTRRTQAMRAGGYVACARCCFSSFEHD